jgi:DNA-binding CsgD family transcriptional regulator
LQPLGTSRTVGCVLIATRLGHDDLDAALSLVSEAAAANGVQPFEHHTIEDLLGVIPADRAGYFEYVAGTNGSDDTFLVDAPVGCPADWDSDAVQATITSWPLRDRARPARPVVKLSDFLTGARLQRNPWYRDVMRAADMEHELKMWLPSPAGRVRGFFFVRGRRARDFDERDRALLELLLPHFAQIRGRWEARRRPPSLTRREVEILGLVAEGLTNAEIARRLWVVQSTVAKHLEQAYRKLGVGNRTAAIARLHEVAARD